MLNVTEEQVAQVIYNGFYEVSVISIVHSGLTPIIVTLEKEKYDDIGCLCIRPQDFFFILIMFYGLLPQPAKKVYSTWFKK